MLKPLKRLIFVIALGIIICITLIPAGIWWIITGKDMIEIILMKSFNVLENWMKK